MNDPRPLQTWSVIGIRYLGGEVEVDAVLPGSPAVSWLGEDCWVRIVEAPSYQDAAKVAKTTEYDAWLKSTGQLG
ncbi:hypothetical protein ACMATS_06410 [Streptoverticillium reticulum]|uniref:hypothetical protein n=1 Tax=Streptoverticillium reticulum TaxID=1433415 RepID=UPI0039BF2156